MVLAIKTHRAQWVYGNSKVLQTFLKKFSEKAKSLNDWTRKDKGITDWNKECTKTFENFKQALKKAPILVA